MWYKVNAIKSRVLDKNNNTSIIYALTHLRTYALTHLRTYALLCLVLCAPLYAQEVPLWVLSKDVYFPSDTYLSALGVGDTNQASHEDAISQLTLYFDSTITVNNTTNASIKETLDSVDKTRSLSSEISVFSEAELPPLSFTEAFFHKQSGKWYTCASINKKEAAKMYAAELQSGIKNVQLTLKNLPTSSPFTKFVDLSKTLKELNALQKTLEKLTVLDFANGENLHSSIVALKNDCTAKRQTLKERMKFSIRIENDCDDAVAIALQEILENEGFIYDPDGALCLNGNIKTAITENDAGVFVTPRLSLNIIDTKNGEKSLASYAKAYKRWGHINVEGAKKKAFVEVEKDLRAHFMEIFR